MATKFGMKNPLQSIAGIKGHAEVSQSQSEVKLFGPRALVKAAITVSDVGDDLFSAVNKALDVLRRYCSF